MVAPIPQLENRGLSYNPDTVRLAEGLHLQQAPAFFYGKSNKAIHWGGQKWSPKQEDLARMALFSGTVDGLYSGLHGKFEDPGLEIVAAKNSKDWEQMVGSKSNLGNVIHTPAFQIADSSMSDFIGGNKPVAIGETDCVFFENSRGGEVDIVLGLKFSDAATGGRSGLSFLKISVSEETAENLKVDFENNPKRPYELATLLFPNGFISSLEPDQIRSAWREKGKQVLSQENPQFLNRFTGFQIVDQSAPTDAESLFNIASRFEENMVQNALNASRMTRRLPQKHLMTIDLRGLSVAEINDKKTYKEKTKIIDCS